MFLQNLVWNIVVWLVSPLISRWCQNNLQMKSFLRIVRNKNPPLFIHPDIRDFFLSRNFIETINIGILFTQRKAIWWGYTNRRQNHVSGPNPCLLRTFSEKSCLEICAIYQNISKNVPKISKFNSWRKLFTTHIANEAFNKLEIECKWKPRITYPRFEIWISATLQKFLSEAILLQKKSK